MKPVMHNATALIVLLSAAAFIISAPRCDAAASPTSQPISGPGSLQALTDICKKKGLSQSGQVLLLPAAEAEVHNGVRGIRIAKAKLAEEASARRKSDRAIKDLNAQELELEAQYLNIVNEHDGISIKDHKEGAALDRYNTLVRQGNVLHDNIDSLKRQIEQMTEAENKLPDSSMSYDGTVADAELKAERAEFQYQSLTHDVELRSALAAFNQTAKLPIKLGPSSGFKDDVAFIHQCQAAASAAGIPVTMAGSPRVEAVLNGKVKRTMIWDSGAYFISLSPATAEELGLHPTDHDPTQELVIANGKHVKAKSMVLDSIRVGPYIAENVECVVLPTDAKGADDLLGDSFQSRFICHLDIQAGQLHLVPKVSAAPASTTAPTAIASISSSSNPAGLEPGLVAQLFTDPDFSKRLKNRIDRQIYFEWGQGGPDPQVPGGVFSIRWTGILQVRRTATYAFEESFDDGLHVWIDDKNVIGHDTPADNAHDTVNLTYGPHPIKIEFRNIIGEGRLLLRWAQEGGFPLQQFQRDALWHNRADAKDAEPAPKRWRTEMAIANSNGEAFTDDAPRGAILVGFALTTAKTDGHDFIRSLRPIYRANSGDVAGRQYGIPDGPTITLLARQEFAVGAVNVVTGHDINGLSLHFLRVKGDTLAPSDFYDSLFIGQSDGAKIKLGENKPILGIYGIADERLGGFGLIEPD